MKDIKEIFTKNIPPKYMTYINKKPIIKLKRGVLNPNNSVDLNLDKTKSASISTMTWNILASGYTNPSNYYYVAPEYLEENHRFNIMAYDVLNNSCDLICLQEVEKRVYDKVFSLIDREYDGIYERRTGLTCDGLSFFYKKNKLSKIYYELQNLNKFSFDVKYLPSEIVTKIKKIPMTYNIAQYIIFEPNCDQLIGKFDYLIAVNLHLFWDPTKEIIKYIQMYEVLAKVNELYKKYSNNNNKVLVLLNGDFNSLPNSNVINLILDKIDARTINSTDLPLYLNLNELLKKNENNLKFYSSHDKNIYLTNIKPDFSGTLDHIFYSSNDIFQESEVSFFDTDLFKKENALPNSFHTSDHIYLTSKFYL
jgi:CCR4-NOT transcription complex subunit 6